MKPKKPAAAKPAPLPDATLDDLREGAKPFPVDCPELGTAGLRMHLRYFSGPELDDWEAGQYARVDAAEARLKAGKGKPLDKYATMQNVRARLVHALAVTADGAQLYGPEDLALVEQMHPKALDRLYHQARLAHGMVEEDLAEAAGKSDAATGADSATG